MKGIGFLAVIAVIFAGMAVGRELPRRPCGTYFDSGYDECVLARVGAKSAERHRDSDEELIRVLVQKGVRIVPDIVIVEVVFPKEGVGQLTIRDPLDGRFNRSYAIPRAQFLSLRAHFLLMPSLGTDPNSEKTKEGLETVCIDPASGWIETVLNGKIKRAEFDYCQDESKYIDDILSFAVLADPACAPLVSFERWPADALRQCLHLKGEDRFRAANAYLASERLNEGDYEKRIDPFVTLKFPQKRSIEGLAAIAEIQKLVPSGKGHDEYYCYPTDASADASQISVNGICEYDKDPEKPTPLLRAKTVQIWKLGADDSLRLLSWRIGEFR